jgi:proline iminopeptidase
MSAAPMDREGFVDVPGGRVWWGSVGEGGAPLLCVHGGPGFTHNYLEPFIDLADERPVVFYDQLGCGRSERPADTSLWTLERHVAELDRVVEALELGRYHLFGSSWGGMLAMQFMLDRRPAQVASLTLAGSPASVPLFVEQAEDLLAELPPGCLETIRHHEERGFTACPEYTAAMMPFLRKHVCRMDPWPEHLERSYAEAGTEVYETMCGPSEFTVIGNLSDWDVLGRLGEIAVPTLVTGGRHDHCQPRHLEAIQERIPGSRLEILEDASHHAFDEQRDAYMAIARQFLRGVEEEAA